MIYVDNYKTFAPTYNATYIYAKSLIEQSVASSKLEVDSA